jgi:CubicO group peptidase (beta-lactamase class C family)
MNIRLLRPAAVPLLASTLLFQYAFAQETTASPQSVGLSPQRLNQITTVVQGSVDRGEIAGAVTLVARHGQVVWLKAAGYQDRENHKSMRTDSIFRICSMTKPIVSLARPHRKFRVRLG